MKKLDFIIPVISIAVIVISAFRLFTIYSGYRAGEAEYNTLNQEVVSEQPVDQGEKPDNNGLPNLQIDFTKLESINEDVVGWIYYEPLAISYPIVQGEDNEYYTHYTFENEKNTMASIFLDYRNASDFTDYNTLVYGHNMKNGSMFGSLKELSQDTTIMDDNPYFFLYTKDGVQRYQILALCSINVSSDIYNLITEEEEYTDYKALIKANANYYAEVDTSKLTAGRMLLLSTCSGRNSSRRLVLCGVPVTE